MNAAFCCAQVADGIDKIGPCGGGGGEHCDVIKIPHGLESITVWYGLVVDSIQFSYVDREKNTHTTKRWGGPGGFEHITVINAFQTIMHAHVFSLFFFSYHRCCCH